MKRNLYLLDFHNDEVRKGFLSMIAYDSFHLGDRGYAKPYLADKRRLVKVGVNFSSKTRTIADWQEA